MSAKPKPATPPKPDPARFSCFQEAQNKVENEENLDRRLEKPTDQVKLLKRGSTLPPKPALYPKPQSALKKSLEKVRPEVPRRPENIVSVPTNNRESSNSTDGVKRRSNLSLTVKAPVARLEEFDDKPCSPVRPPRSPKIKVFLDGPFEKQDEKPELPVKKRLLSSVGKGDKDWDNIKKRSASLGRTENNPTLNSKTKCFSLSRKLSLENLEISEVPVKVSPVPPPRRRKKSDDALTHPAEITVAKEPDYAQVNYAMKKNRRSASGHEDGKVALVESRLLLTSTGSTLQCNNNVRLIDSTDSDQTTLQKPTTLEEIDIMSTPISDLISEDKTTDSGSQACPTAINSHEETEIASPTLQQYTDNSNEDSTATMRMESTVVQRESELFRIIRKSDENEELSGESVVLREILGEGFDNDAISRVLPIGSYLHRNIVESTITPSVDTVTSIIDSSGAGGYNVSANTTVLLFSTKQQQNTEEDVNTSVAPTHEQEIEVMTSNDRVIDKCGVPEVQDVSNTDAQFKEATSSKGAASEKAGPCSMVNDNIIKSESVLCEAINPVVQLVPNAATTKDTHPLVQGALTNTNSIYINSRPISSSEVSDVSDLVVVESQPEELSKVKSRLKVNRRQSWSSSQETSPSPDHFAERKVKHRSGVPWCDEGDLSNGALADSDTGSSDNTARKSTEDVNKRVNGSGYPVRSKIANWFDSFGKGAKKKERKVRSGSQFFANSDQRKVNQAQRPAPPIPGQQEKQDGAVMSDQQKIREDDQLRVPTSVTRTSSGVSDILDNIPVADQDRDSESDAEDPVQVSSPMTEAQRKEKKVSLIAKELMTSERYFVEVLKLLNIDFLRAVDAAGTEQCPVIPPNELSKILQSLPQLQKLNEELLLDLELRINNWSSYPKIADVIVKKGPFLKLYSSYIKNYGAQCKYLDDFCAKYPKFNKVVKDFEASSICKKLGVKHYMLKPVQRIPQYRLFLEDYQRNLEPTSMDYQHTVEALTIVREVADHANRTIALGDHLSKLMELQSQLSDDYEIIKPGRTYLKDGELFKLSRKVRHPRHFILLNDCLLYTSRLNTSLLRVNKELPLAGMKVLVPQGDDNLNEFNIISIARSFTLSASSAEERREWIEALENAIKDHTSRKLTFQPMNLAPTSATESLKLGHQAPVWIQDARVTMCQSCTTQFTLTYRRHHCRACGKVVCGVCSEYRAPLRYRGFQAERVCEDCYNAILREFNEPLFPHLMHDVLIEAGFKNPPEDLESIKNTFKKLGAGSKKKLMQLKDIPQRLKEVAANDAGSQVSGWLSRKARRSWKTLWFVLKEQVLYVYRAQEDVVALESIPILGYKVEAFAERHFELYEGIDARLVFQLSHPGQQPLVFHAKDQHMANRWIKAMEDATVLH